MLETCVRVRLTSLPISGKGTLAKMEVHYAVVSRCEPGDDVAETPVIEVLGLIGVVR